MREISKEKLKPIAAAAARALGGAALAGGEILGGYAPFAVGWVAASGGGKGGLFSLLGAFAGAALFLPFSAALRTCASCVLLFTANNAFAETKFSARAFFWPLCTAAMFLSVEFVYLTRADASQAAYCLLAAMLAAAYAFFASAVLKKGSSAPNAALLGTVLGFLAAALCVELPFGFVPARVVAMAAVALLSFSRASLGAALAVGLTVDLTSGASRFLYGAVSAFCALAVSLERGGNRVRAALLFLAAVGAFALPLGLREGAMLLYEAVGAALIFLLLPPRFLRGKREVRAAAQESEERSAAKRLLGETAAAFREIYESLVRLPQHPEENPAVIFDRAAERVCRSCSQKNDCWQENYSKTYNALNDATAALLEHGVGKGEYFPPHFANRCVRFPSFLAAVNVELNAFLLRKSYRAQLSLSRSRSAQQYAELSELLSASAQQVAAARETLAAAIPYRVGRAFRAREGQSVSGDALAAFETEDGKLFLLLSDGMGSGEAARREAALALRLLERFLRAGVEVRVALKTLSGALSLRGEGTESFTTLDVLALTLSGGEGQLYKLGAAPSYTVRGKTVRRVTCSSPPVGLGEGDGAERTQLTLRSGSIFVMLSDGAVDASDDKWLCKLLAEWKSEDAQALAETVLRESEKHCACSDDASVLTLILPKNGLSQV